MQEYKHEIVETNIDMYDIDLYFAFCLKYDNCKRHYNTCVFKSVFVLCCYSVYIVLTMSDTHKK